MNFPTLEIENFLAIQKAKFNLNNRGLVSIQGKNLFDSSADSNGTGKSSVPDALCWCFFGVTAREVIGDDVINDIAKKDTRVSTQIDDDGTVYRVTRYRKHKTGKNRLTVELKSGKKWKDLTKGVDKLTQQLLEGIIGCSIEVFKAAIYAGQEDMPDLPSMTDKTLKVLIEEASGLDLLQQASVVARQKLTSASAKFDTAVADHGRAIAAIDTSGFELSDLQAEHKSWDEQNAVKIAAKTEEAKSAAARQKAETPVDVSLIEIEQKRIGGLQSAIDGRKQEELEEKALEGNLNGLNHTKSQLSADQERITNDARQIKEDIANIESKIGQPCKECGKPTEKGDVAALRSGKMNDAAAKIGDLQRCKQALALVTADAESAQERLTAYRATMTDVSASIVAQSECRAVISNLEARQRDQQRAIDEVRRLVEEIRDLKAQDNPIKSLLTAKNKSHAELIESEKTLDKEKAQAEADIQIYKDAAEIFGAAGIRAHILDTVTPFLNQRTSHYLGHLSDGNIIAEWSTLGKTAKGELREKFNIAVTNSKGAKKFKGLSGGEKRKVRVATALALQDLVSSRASKPINLFMADEVDDAVDKSGLERLMVILEEKARERGTVLVISHNSLTDWIRDSITMVKGADGFSRIES